MPASIPVLFLLFLLLVPASAHGAQEKVIPEHEYFYVQSSPGAERYTLTTEQIHILEDIARKGDSLAGARLYVHYTFIEYPEAADEAIEMVPRGNGIEEYDIRQFVYYSHKHKQYVGGRLLNGEMYYLMDKQVKALTPLALAGNRQAAKRLGEYYGKFKWNNYRGRLYKKLSEGNDSALPALRRACAKGRMDFATDNLWGRKLDGR